MKVLQQYKKVISFRKDRQTLCLIEIQKGCPMVHWIISKSPEKMYDKNQEPKSKKDIEVIYGIKRNLLGFVGPL